jgi:hypothetical protein
MTDHLCQTMIWIVSPSLVFLRTFPGEIVALLNLN